LITIGAAIVHAKGALTGSTTGTNIRTKAVTATGTTI
jgi:hypothetical protein